MLKLVSDKEFRKLEKNPRVAVNHVYIGELQFTCLIDTSSLLSDRTPIVCPTILLAAIEYYDKNYVKNNFTSENKSRLYKLFGGGL